MRVKFLFLLLFASFTSLPCANAAPLRVVVVDQTGAGFPDVLLIVRPLEGGAEVFRVLSDKNGTIPTHDLPVGPYQLIATCPYGLCQTTVREFMIKDEFFDLKLPVAVMPTRGNTFTIGHIEHRDIEILDRGGRPIPSVPVLVRDAIAQNERWYKTGTNGTVTVDVPPGAEMTIIAVSHGALVSTNVKTHDGNDKTVLHLQL